MQELLNALAEEDLTVERLREEYIKRALDNHPEAELNAIADLIADAKLRRLQIKIKLDLMETE